MPMWMIGGSAAANLGGSIFSGLMGSSGASKQAAAIRYAADKASDTALTLNSRARSDLQPFRDLGVKSGSMLSDLFEGKTSIDDLFKAGSLYNFESEMGTRSLNRQLASRGQYGSGAGLESLALFDKSLVAEEGDRYFNKIFGTTQLGEAAAAQQASNTTATGNSIADIQAKAGINEGQAYQNQYAQLGQAGAGGLDAIGGGLQNYVQYGLYKPFFDSFSSGRGSGNGYVGNGPHANGEMDMGVFN
jgi:hypothetical protein